MSEHLLHGRDGRTRCSWCGTDDLYRAYHDSEWGFPVDDDTRVFEKLCLEGFQSGLSWLTILRKRESFRKAFRGFEIDKVAPFAPRDVDRMLRNSRIVRHRGKIESTINNARRARELRAEFGSIAAYVWRFEPPRSTPRTAADIPARTGASTEISRDLKKRGWSFVGPTTAYAFMQAMGLVNDHLEGCDVRNEVERARRRFRLPDNRAAR